MLSKQPQEIRELTYKGEGQNPPKRTPGKVGKIQIGEITQREFWKAYGNGEIFTKRNTNISPKDK